MIAFLDAGAVWLFIAGVFLGALIGIVLLALAQAAGDE